MKIIMFNFLLITFSLNCFGARDFNESDCVLEIQELEVSDHALGLFFNVVSEDAPIRKNVITEINKLSDDEYELSLRRLDNNDSSTQVFRVGDVFPSVSIHYGFDVRGHRTSLRYHCRLK